MGQGPLLPLESLRIATSDPTLRASLEECGCAEVITDPERGASEGGSAVATVSFVTATVPTGGLAEWTADSINGERPPVDTTAIFVATETLKGESGNGGKGGNGGNGSNGGSGSNSGKNCVVELGELALQRLALSGSDDAARLAWVVESARPSARPTTEKPAGVIAAEPTTAALLLPAVQKVRAAALAQSKDEGGYPLFVAGASASSRTRSTRRSRSSPSSRRTRPSSRMSCAASPRPSTRCSARARSRTTTSCASRTRAMRCATPSILSRRSRACASTSLAGFDE